MRLFPLLLAVFGCVHAPAPAAVTARAVVLGEVTSDSVDPIIEILHEGPEHLTLIIDSPGGSVYAGMRLIEAMQNAQYGGTRVTCVVPRLAASMAAVILEGCDERLMGRQATLLFHTASIGGAAGNAWELERLVRELHAINTRIAIFVAGRLGMPLAEYEAHVADRDFWMGYEQALEVHAVDAVLP